MTTYTVIPVHTGQTDELQRIATAAPRLIAVYPSDQNTLQLVLATDMPAQKGKRQARGKQTSAIYAKPRAYYHTTDKAGRNKTWVEKMLATRQRNKELRAQGLLPPLRPQEDSTEE